MGNRKPKLLAIAVILFMTVGIVMTANNTVSGQVISPIDKEGATAETSSGLGPLLVGLLEDSTGSYTIPFTVTALVTFGGALIVLRARPVPARRPAPGVRR